MRMNGRLRRLERAAGVGPDDGCPMCRDRRGHIVFTTSQRMSDGSTIPEGDWPLPCEQCGEIAEQIIEIVKPIVDAEGKAADRRRRAPDE
jgi:hypothetical protein